MENHRLYGPSAAEKGWVPAPSFLLRRNRVLRIFEEQPCGDLLEIGCGAATLIQELSGRGFICTALETSQPALELAQYFNQSVPDVTFCREQGADWAGRFDYLMAYEVLEHIDDDSAALREWRDWLKPGGLMVMSVPAHMKKWTASDEWAGHYRRYERDGLKKLLDNCGFSVLDFESYGFPLANMIASVRARNHTRQLAERAADDQADQKHNSAMSGVARTVETRLYPWLCSPPGQWVMHGAFFTQGLFSKMDVGTGYLVVARKR